MKNLAHALINIHIVTGLTFVVISIAFLLMMAGIGGRWTIVILAGIIGVVGCGTFIIGQFYYKKFIKLVEQQTETKHIKDENDISN